MLPAAVLEAVCADSVVTAPAAAAGSAGVDWVCGCAAAGTSAAAAAAAAAILEASRCSRTACLLESWPKASATMGVVRGRPERAHVVQSTVLHSWEKHVLVGIE
jgi:hypothetical protein